MTAIRSPLRYPGGKHRAAPLIYSLLPTFDEYREPFIGGGSVLLHIKQLHPDKVYWANDLCFELYRFWNAAQNHIDLLINQICHWKNVYEGKYLHHLLKNNTTAFSGIEIAAAFFILNRISFSGTSLSGGFSNDAYTSRFTESSIARLRPFSSVIQNMNITGQDYKEVVQSKGKNVVMYLDPPYYTATKSALYGKKGILHKTFDHVRFAKIMKDCKHSWLITYDDCEYIRELFSFAKIIPWDLTYGMRNVGKKSSQKAREIFVSNYL